MEKLWWCAFVLSLLSLTFPVSDGLHVAEKGKRACIIGAGYCGLAAARFMKDYGVEFKVFEATRYVGGTWRFEPRVGTDEDGLPLYTSMYKNLRINIPRMTMEYTGFPFPEGATTFPTGECFYRYIKKFAERFDLYENIQFRSLVTSVNWAEDHWNVTYMKTDTKANFTEECDFLAIASGEFSKPTRPDIENLSSFQGNVIHSHDYRDAELYRGRRVMVVGAGPSGFDLAVQLANVSAKLVHSHHKVYQEPFFSKTYVKKPDIKKFTPNGAVFKDDTFEELDDVIFCTGYNLSYPFLDDSSAIVTSNKFILPLYQHMVNILHPSMVFVGTPRILSSAVREAQAEYAAALAAGKFKLPSKEKMLSIWMSQVRALLPHKSVENLNVFTDEMDNYFTNLTMEAGIYQRPPVQTRIKDFNIITRLNDLINYRDYDFEITDENNFKRWYNPRKEDSCPF